MLSLGLCIECLSIDWRTLAPKLCDQYHCSPYIRVLSTRFLSDLRYIKTS